MEIGTTVSSLDPAVAPANADEAAAKREIESLIYEKGSTNAVAGSGPFRISEWQPGKHLALAANSDFAGGRPFVDAIEIEMGRNVHDRLADLQLGRADLIEISAEDARDAAVRGVRVSASQPDELIALIFPTGHAETDDARVREGIADSIERAAIVEFLLQKEGEPAGGLLPQWLSGTAFLFTTAPDRVRGKELRAQIASSPEIRLGYDASDSLEESIAERIAVDARESGFAVTPTATNGAGARLVRQQMSTLEADAALRSFTGMAAPTSNTSEQVYDAQRTALDGFREVPLVWLPRVYGLSERVRDWQAPATGESWPLADVWLDAGGR